MNVSIWRCIKMFLLFLNMSGLVPGFCRQLLLLVILDPLSSRYHMTAVAVSICVEFHSV